MLIDLAAPAVTEDRTRAVMMRRVAVLTIAAKVRCNQPLTSRELDLLRGELRATAEGGRDD